MKASILGAALLAAACSAPALAASGPATLARVHFRAIAEGDVPAIMMQYASNPVLEWVGGPLDGTYTGQSAIQKVWKEFSGAVAERSAEVRDLRTSANPAGATVTANVLFTGQKNIKVRYVLTYRHGRIVDEIWQIDPKLDFQNG